MLLNPSNPTTMPQEQALETITRFSDAYGLTQKILFGTGETKLPPELITQNNLFDLIKTLKHACEKIDNYIREQKEALNKTSKTAMGYEIGSVYAKRKHTLNLGADFLLKSVKKDQKTHHIQEMVVARASINQELRELEQAYESLFGQTLPSLDELLVQPSEL